MKYYSEVLRKFYDDAEKLEKEEAEAKTEEMKKEEDRQRLKKRLEELNSTLEELKITRAAYEKAWNEKRNVVLKEKNEIEQKLEMTSTTQSFENEFEDCVATILKVLGL